MTREITPEDCTVVGLVGCEECGVAILIDESDGYGDIVLVRHVEDPDGIDPPTSTAMVITREEAQGVAHVLREVLGPVVL